MRVMTPLLVLLTLLVLSGTARADVISPAVQIGVFGAVIVIAVAIVAGGVWFVRWLAKRKR